MDDEIRLHVINIIELILAIAYASNQAFGMGDVTEGIKFEKASMLFLERFSAKDMESKAILVNSAFVSAWAKSG
eukprot:590139-Ditylum_brightwellii.AAC.1